MNTLHDTTDSRRFSIAGSTKAHYRVLFVQPPREYDVYEAAASFARLIIGKSLCAVINALRSRPVDLGGRPLKAPPVTDGRASQTLSECLTSPLNLSLPKSLRAPCPDSRRRNLSSPRFHPRRLTIARYQLKIKLPTALFTRGRKARGRAKNY